MKQIIQNYSFDASAGTVTFTDFATINLERVLLITDVTHNTVVYIFNTAGRGGTVSGNILTLECDTATMADTDKLQITYDCADGDPIYGAGLDADGNTNVNLAVRLDSTNDSITTYPVSHGYTYISSATTTTAKAEMGHLAKIIVGETAAGAITLYDNTNGSGTIIGVLKASIPEGSYEFNVGFGVGLTIVTAAASKITVVWR